MSGRYIMTIKMHDSEKTPPRDVFETVFKSNGFTLVELIVVVAILGVLAGISIPAYSNYVNKAKIARAIGELATIDKDIQAYYIDKNIYPPDNDLSVVNRATLKDPWGQLYIYRRPAAPLELEGGLLHQVLNPSRDYDLYSNGPNMLTTTPDCSTPACYDDIVRADDGSTFGVRGDY
jgi:type II secretion system protein G